jgi:hypothetical protein
VTVIVSEQEIDFLLAYDYELSRQDAGSIGRARVRKALSTCRLSGGRIAGLALAGLDRIHHMFAELARSCTMAGLGTLGDRSA